MKIIKILIIILVFIFVGTVQLPANGLNLNSLGARASAMGGAYVGLADDFSAVFWNPAGLSQIRNKTIGFFGTDLIPKANYRLGIPVELGTFNLIEAETNTSHYLAGLGAYIHPVSESIVAAVGIYNLSGLGVDWDGGDFSLISNSMSYTWSSNVGMITISPALSVKINDQFSLGAALNINRGMFKIAAPAGIREIPYEGQLVEFDLGQQMEELAGWGYGITLGLLYSPSSSISFGASFRTGSRITLEGDASITNFPLIGIPETSELESDVTWPVWLAVGGAFRPNERMTFTADVHYTHWSAVDKIELSFTDPIWQASTQGIDSVAMNLNWKNSLQIRFGMEYLIKGMALRCGYYYDPSPTPDEIMNILLPTFDFHAFTFGVGYGWEGLRLDAGLEYLMGRDRDNPIRMDEEMLGMPGKYGMNILIPNFSVSYRW